MIIPNYYNSYVLLFDLLDGLWDEYRNDDLGGMLGSMNPNIFSNKMPMDKSMYLDWEIIMSNNKLSEITENGNIKELTPFIIQYLSKQEKKFGINLSVIKIRISQMTEG